MLPLLPTPRKLAQTPGNVPAGVSPRVSVARATGHPQGYSLIISPDSVTIVGDDPAGAFYGCQTLLQLQRLHPTALPCLRIEDWPDFAARGVMLDISRDKVPTMSTLLAMVDQFAELKINQVQLYTEHTFAYAGHEAVWKDASPMTADEIRILDKYCRDRFIELVPNQNSFGHLERWFRHPQYQHLAEKPEGFLFPSGIRMSTGFSLNPTDPRSIGFVESLYDQLLPNFKSTLVNVGCDETYDIGLGRSKAAVEDRGRERVYLDFVLQIHRAVQSRGRTMLFWGDIILHKPELLDLLPKHEIIALNWGYEADHPFESETAAFRKSGVPFYVCPGTSSWCSITGRTDNALANLKNAAINGLANGAAGYLVTDWGDYGHLQYPPISYPGFTAAAAYSWCYESNRELSIEAALNRHIVMDDANVVGRVLLDLGRVCQGMEPMSNGTWLFWTLIDQPERARLYENVTAEQYSQAAQKIEDAIAPLGRARLARPDAGLIIDELRNGAAMLTHACRRGQFLRDAAHAPDPTTMANELSQIISEHRRLWLARNRPGGVNDSAARLQRLVDGYKALHP